MFQDLRFAFRLLVKQPGFTLVAILAIGVGIGQATNTFNSFSTILLKPVPHVVAEDRVVYLTEKHAANPEAHMSFSLPDFADVRAQSTTLEGLTTVMDRTFILGAEDKPARLLGSSITAAGFNMLGVKPHLGRTFGPADEAPDAPRTAILSHRVWMRFYGGRHDIIGTSTRLNGAQHTVIGVLPPGFNFPENSDIWTTFPVETKEPHRGDHSFPVYARMKPGVSLDQVNAELATIAARIATAHADTNDGVTFVARSIREEATEDVALLMKLALGAVIFVLLIACANVANLMLARSATRAHEIAIRFALGATRGRVVRQVLTESLLIGVLGGALGLLIAVWDKAIFLHTVPVELPFWMNFDFDWRVFVFATAAAVGSALLFGLFPALQISRATATTMKEGSRSSTGGPRSLRVRQVLVVAQVSLALVLLIGAGLMARSFMKLQAADPGFDPRGVLTFRVGLPPTQFQDKAQNRRFFTDLTRKIETVPGVTAVGAVTQLPGSGISINAFLIEGQPTPKALMEAPMAVSREVTPNYFNTMRVPLLAGRFFTDDDTADKPAVAIVDQAFVDRWFPGQDVVGKRIGLENWEEPKWATIVGVVGTVPQKLGAMMPEYGYYRPIAQNDYNFLSYVVRVRGAPETYHAAMQKAVASVMPGIPIYYVESMERVLEKSYWQKKFFGHVFMTYGAVALFLASLGVYGVMAYSVSQRTQEIGMRMALGAQPTDVLRLVTRQGFWLVGLGMGIGLVAALGLTRFMADFLYGVSPSDPPTYFALSLVLAAVGLIACWLPARRATRINPLTAIRAD